MKKLLIQVAVFAVTGLLAAAISIVASNSTSRDFSDIGLVLEFFSWGVWPAKFFGLGAGEFSIAMQLVLATLNAILFSAIGLIVALALLRRKSGLSWILAFYIAVVGLWCFWLLGFEVSKHSVFSALPVIIFYSIPLLVVVSISRRERRVQN